MGMLIIINSGDPITNPDCSSLPSGETYNFKRVGEKIATRFIGEKKAILLSPTDTKSDFAGSEIYKHIPGGVSLLPTSNLVEWIQTQTDPVVIILNQDAAKKLARDYCSQTTYYDEVDVPWFGPSEAVVFNLPNITVVRA